MDDGLRGAKAGETAPDPPRSRELLARKILDSAGDVPACWQPLTRPLWSISLLQLYRHLEPDSGGINFTASNLPAGNYNFTARAFGNSGLSATSAMVNVFVLTNAALADAARLPDGRFRFSIIGIAGQTYATESSSNLIQWSAISTNVAPANLFNVTDATSTNILQRFYRARQHL
jgi:hypothetical protein